MRRLKVLLFFLVPMIVVRLSFAQSEYHPLTFNIGGGLTSQTGRISKYLDYGGNLQVSGGLNLNRYASVLGTFMFNGVGLTGRALNQVNAPDGYANIYTLSVDPKLRFHMGHGGAYVLGGGGWLRRTVTFTKPVLASAFIYDPWWGYVGPALIPANQKLGSVSSNAGMWDVGGGFDFPLPRTQWKLYVEVRYVTGLTSNTHTTIVPLTLGIRW